MTRAAGTMTPAALAAALWLGLFATAAAHDSEHQPNASAAGSGKAAEIVQPQAPAGSAAAEYFPNVELVDQWGERHRFYSDLLQDTIGVITAFFTRCEGFCPIGTALLADLQDHFAGRVGTDLHFLSLTVDPVHDTPARLQDYARKLGAGPGWLFLTGRMKDMELVHARLGTFRASGGQVGSDPESHGNKIFLLNLRTETLDWAFGPAVTSEQLARQIESLLVAK